MTEGTSQGLFVVVAIVIFGIFVGMSYTIFGKEGLTSSIGNLVEEAVLPVTDFFKGVENRELIDLKTIYKDGSTVILEKDLARNKLKVTSEGLAQNGVIIPTRSLTSENKKYILTFNMRLDSGNVYHIGGHLGGLSVLAGDGIKDVNITVNGSKVTPINPDASNNDWYSGVPLPYNFKVGDTLSVEVAFYRDYFSNDYADAPIKIQPNRQWGSIGNGYGEPYSVTLSKLSMLEMK